MRVVSKMKEEKEEKGEKDNDVRSESNEDLQGISE